MIRVLWRQVMKEENSMGGVEECGELEDLPRAVCCYSGGKK